MSRNSYRIRFEFWLDMEKPEQEEIADLIEILKNKRLYSKAIRDGLRLYWDLCQGRVDVLVEQFPLIQAQMTNSDSGYAPDNEEVLNQLERLENLIRRTDTITAAQTPKGSGGLQALTAPQLAKPIFDDDDDDFELTVTKADTSQSNASENFLKSMMALQER